MLSPFIPVQDLTVPIFLLYNFFLFLFSLFLGIRIRNHFVRLGALSLAMSSIIGIILLSFPMDPNGDPTTIVGFQHNIIVISMSLYIILSLLLFFYGFKKTRNFSTLAKYSLLVGIIISLTGLFTGIAAFLSLSRYVGILERLPVTAFLIWVFRTSENILKSDKRTKYNFFKSKE